MFVEGLHRVSHIEPMEVDHRRGNGVLWPAASRGRGSPVRCFCPLFSRDTSETWKLCLTAFPHTRRRGSEAEAPAPPGPTQQWLHHDPSP